MLLQTNSTFASENSRKYYEDQLTNKRQLLFETENAISITLQALANADGVSEYSMDSGQMKHSSKRNELANLMSLKDSLQKDIEAIESKLHIGGSPVKRIVPR